MTYRHLCRNTFFFLFVLVSVQCSFNLYLRAQVATGSYPYSSIDATGPDSINLGNLNVHFPIPVFHKEGRGIPFFYDLIYDNSLWINSKGTWQPAQNYGWSGYTVATTGYVSYTNKSYVCDFAPPQHGSYNVYANWVYHDAFGVSHPFDGELEYDPKNCDQSIASFQSISKDGSGITLTAARNGAPASQQKLTMPNGVVMMVPTNGTSPGSSITDLHGNTITVSPTGIFTDTTGSTTLTVSGSAPSDVQFTYPITNGGTAAYTVKYSTHNLATNFGCPGINEYRSTAASLVSEIDLPDSTKYTFVYEPTPNISGAVTGRLSLVSLPTGGRISYTYTGGSNGIVCADGSNSGITRTLLDDTANTRVYSRTETSSTSHTDMLDGLGNHATYDFVLPSSAGSQALLAQYYETQRSIYQGSGSTILLSRQTCYNNTTAPCAAASLAWPISQIDQYESIDGSPQRGTSILYNAAGLPIEEDQYDFGTATSRGALLQRRTWTYSQSGVINLVSDNELFTGAGELIGHIGYVYDTRTPTSAGSIPQHTANTGPVGDLNEIVHYVTSTGSHQSESRMYDDAGQLRSSCDVINNCISYDYDSATDSFPKKVGNSTVATIVSTGFSYDVRSGALNTIIDANGNATNTVYDSLLRPTAVNFPDGGILQSSYNPYTSPAQPAVVMTSMLHSGTTYIKQSRNLDSYGRTQSTVEIDSPSNITTDYKYDGNGNTSSISNPYRSTSDSTFGTTNYQYDALDRTIGVIAPGGASNSFIYSGGTVTTTDAFGTKKRLMSDGLGRPIQVLETDASGNFAYATKYLYWQNYQNNNGTYQSVIQQQGGSNDPLQWRQRIFTYDLLGRLVQAVTPESGTTSYTYDCSGSFSLPCSQTDARGSKASYTYDYLYRPISVKYSGPAVSTPSIYYHYDETTANGLTLSNGIGLRTSMVDGSGQTAWSFDKMGRVTAVRKTIGNVTKQFSANYNNDGTPNSIQDFGGLSLAYSYDQRGRQSGLVDSIGNLYASSVTYDSAGHVASLISQNGANSPLFNRTFQYNNRFQVSSIGVTRGSTPIMGFTYGYGPIQQNNGNLLSIQNTVTSGRDSTFSYDSMNRLSQASSTAWGEGYTYDPWGNLLAATPLPGRIGHSFSVSANNANQVSNLVYDASGSGLMTGDQFGNTFTYDASGRLLSAGNASFVYDGDGKRVVKMTPSVTTLDWGGLNGVSNTSDASGNAMGRQISVSGLQVWAAEPGAAGQFIFQDHLGSVRMTADSQGNINDDFDYYPFGEVFKNYISTPAAVRYQYAETQTDPESNSLYAHARNLSPSMGRWNRPDPLNESYDLANPQSLNRYAYVLNQPCISSDPSGLYSCTFRIKLFPSKNSPMNTPSTAQGIQDTLMAILNNAGLGLDFNSDTPDYVLVVADTVPNDIHVSERAIGGTQLINRNLVGQRGSVWGSRLLQYDKGSRQSSTAFGLGLGRAGAHEFGHYALNQTMDSDNFQQLMKGSHDSWSSHKPEDVQNFNFTAAQAAALMKKCLQLHPVGSAHGGSSGGGGGFWYISFPSGGGNNGDVGPGSGYCPQCPPPVLHHRPL